MCKRQVRAAQDALGQQEGVKHRYCRAQQELGLGKKRSLPAKGVGHGIPGGGHRRFRRAEMRENMTLWYVAFEEGGEVGKGGGPKGCQESGCIMSIGHAQKRDLYLILVVLFLWSKIRSNKGFLLPSYKISNLKGFFNTL